MMSTSRCKNYVKALNTFYKEHPALYEMDYDPDGFTWINNISANENMVVFTRNTKKKRRDAADRLPISHR